MEGVESGPIDAPQLVPAGSMWSGDSVYDGTGSAVPRDRWHLNLKLPATLEEAEPDEGGLLVWRIGGRVVCLCGQSGRWRRGLRDGFEDCERDCMDAPDYLPAGGVRRYVAGGEVCAADIKFFRAGWFE